MTTTTVVFLVLLFSMFFVSHSKVFPKDDLDSAFIMHNPTINKADSFSTAASAISNEANLEPTAGDNKNSSFATETFTSSSNSQENAESSWTIFEVVLCICFVIMGLIIMLWAVTQDIVEKELLELGLKAGPAEEQKKKVEKNFGIMGVIG